MGETVAMKQTQVERRRILKKFWKEMGKKFLLIFGIGLLIVMLLPQARIMPVSYFAVFLVAFSVSFFLIFFRVKEKPPELECGDR